MYSPLIILCLQTLVFWLIAFFLYHKRNRYTLIFIYAYIGILTVFTHNFSDLGFAVVLGDWFFLIASFAFFTTLMFCVLLLYLFEGPRAARMAFFVIMASSLFYIATVYLLGFEADTSKWVQLTDKQGLYYLWSLLAISIDVFVMAIAWEVLSRVAKIPLVFRVFLIVFLVLVIDTGIFTTGVFWRSDMYFSILKGNIIIRFCLSLISAPIITYFLKIHSFSEEQRDKPKNFWEILNFKSDLEQKVLDLEDMVKKYQSIENDLSAAQDLYRLAITGSGAGIWKWDVSGNKISWSDKFCELLGYEVDSLGDNPDVFKKLCLPQDADTIWGLITSSFATGNPFEVELQLKTVDGDYKWFLATGVTGFDEKNKPQMFVGAIFDIDEKKRSEIILKKKIDYLTQANKNIIGDKLKTTDVKLRLEKVREQLSSMKGKED